jgi:hypothetical protein
MVLVVSINFDRQLDGLRIASAQAAAQQCAAQPLISTRCPQASCIKAGPCYLGVFLSAPRLPEMALRRQTPRLEHDPEKACPRALTRGWAPIFGKDLAPANKQGAITIPI